MDRANLFLPTVMITSQKIETHSLVETLAFGAQLARDFERGDVIALSGELGAGKTALVKGFAQGLGVTLDVTSPTFTLIHEYQGGRLPLYHIDLYRLDGAAQAGAATTLLDLRELDLPMFNPDDEGDPPPAATRLVEACYGADGMLWSSSFVNVCFVPTSFVSTTGLWPVTVIVSCTVETPICALICALKPTVTRTSSLTTVLKPVSSNLTV